MMEIYERVVTMSEIMTSRQLVKYILDILFGDQSKRVFTNVKGTDERYMTLGRGTLFTDFLNSKNGSGKMTKTVKDGIYHRCRYNLFPEEYRESENVTEEVIREFANRFVCLFSCLFDINPTFFKLRKEDTPQMIIKKKENICSFLLLLLEIFNGKCEVECEVVKEELLSVFSYLRFELYDIDYSRYTSRDVRKFQDALFNAGITVIQTHNYNYNQRKMVASGFAAWFDEMMLEIDKVKILCDSKSAEEFWEKSLIEEELIPKEIYFWKAYLLDVVVRKISEGAIYVHLYYSNDDKYISFFYEINAYLHQFEIETVENPSNEQNLELIRSTTWRRLSQMFKDLLYFTVFQSQLNVRCTADDY